MCIAEALFNLFNYSNYKKKSVAFNSQYTSRDEAILGFNAAGNKMKIPWKN